MQTRSERLDHRFGLSRAAGELDIGCDRFVSQPQVVGDRTEKVRRVLGPAFDTEIDLRDRTVAIALEEARHLLLEQRRGRARAVSRRKDGGTFPRPPLPPPGSPP